MLQFLHRKELNVDNQTPKYPTSPVTNEMLGNDPLSTLKTSPVPNKGPKELSFPDAMREVLNKKRVTRLAWETNDNFGLLFEGFLQIFIRGEYHKWLVNDGDLNAIDWIVLPEQEDAK